MPRRQPSRTPTPTSSPPAVAPRPPNPGTPTARREITAAALRLIGDAESGEFLRTLTPERLARDSGRSASTVRYHFGGDDGQGSGTFAFQRRDLTLEALAMAIEGRAAAAATTIPTFVRAAESLREGTDLDSVLRAVVEGLLPFMPGPSGPEAAARERMCHLGLALCDNDAAAARLLREGRTRQTVAYRAVVHAVLAATGRELVPGRTAEELGDAIHTLLDGHVTRLRFDPGAPIDGPFAAGAAVFVAFTRKPGQHARDPVGELLGRATPG